ncbi:MAG: NAD(P)/FAD-dependent oxidoreductase [Pseudomonadota bacterium]
MRKAKSVAIIGGGVAGLSAAALLSRRGLEVKLFEANSKVGGCCATTNLSGYTFNDGALYLALPGLLDHLFEKIGLDRSSSLPLRKISANQTTSLPDGTTVTIGEGLDIRIDGGNGAVDHARLQEELAAFMRKWEPVLRFMADDILLHPLSLSRFLAKGWRHLYKFRGTVASELNASFSSEAARAAMSGALLYTGCPPEKMPIISLIGLVAMFRDGFFLPEGGMGRLPETLSHAVLSNGGEIHLNSGVSRILVKNGRVRGIEVAHADSIEFDAVISTVSGMHTFGTLMDPVDVPAGMRRKVRHANLSHKGYLLQLGLTNKIDVRSHCNNVLPMMEDQYQTFLPGENAVQWPIYTVPTVTMPELAPAGGSIVEMFPPINQGLSADDWSEDRKEEVAGLAVESLKRMHEIDIAVRRILSPKEFQESLHLYGGALYGLSPVAGLRALYPHRSPVPGLYQAGQTTWPGFGVGPAAMSGIFAAEALIERTAL